MNKNYLIVGEAPGKNWDGKGPAFSGRSGKFLAKLAGLEGVISDHFPTVNLLKDNPGDVGKSFDMVRARVEAQKILRRNPGVMLILAGKRTASAFGLFPTHTRYFMNGKLYCSLGQNRVRIHHYIVIPHPSGLNRVWNDPKVVRKAKKFLGGL